MEESQKSSGHDEDKADAGESSRVDDANVRVFAFTASGIASIGEVFRGTSQAPEASARRKLDEYRSKIRIHCVLVLTA